MEVSLRIRARTLSLGLQDLQMDSAFMIELALNIENEFEFVISDADLENIKTVGDLIRIIKQQTTKR